MFTVAAVSEKVLIRKYFKKHCLKIKCLMFALLIKSQLDNLAWTTTLIQIPSTVLIKRFSSDHDNDQHPIYRRKFPGTNTKLITQTLWKRYGRPGKQPYFYVTKTLM